MTSTEMEATARRSCLALSVAFFRFFCPIYWEQTMVPPAERAANAWITSTLMESTSETAEIAAEPTLLTIMLSAVPIREVRNCSATSGIRSIFSA